MYEEYLTHHGILGMKWGIRRYQNKDGTLTAAGRKRMRKLEKERSKLDKKMSKVYGESSKETESEGKTSESVEKTKAKSLFEMSDQELNSYISRMNLEKQYKQLMKERYDAEHPKKKPLIDGRDIVSKIISNSVTSVGSEAGKYALGTMANKIAKSLNLPRDISSAGIQYQGNAKKEEKKKKDDD